MWLDVGLKVKTRVVIDTEEVSKFPAMVSPYAHVDRFAPAGVRRWFAISD